LKGEPVALLIRRTRPKVFGIGLSRTGTASLNGALAALGWKSVHWPLSLSEIAGAEASTDVTVACRFEALARVHPEAKFILTVRELDGWVTSILRFFNPEHREWVKATTTPDQFDFVMEAERRLYGRELCPRKGQPPWTPGELKRVCRKHIENVFAVFKRQPARLLAYDLCGGAGWGPLCGFLGVPVPVPGRPFPCWNVQPKSDSISGKQIRKDKP